MSTRKYLILCISVVLILFFVAALRKLTPPVFPPPTVDITFDGYTYGVEGQAVRYRAINVPPEGDFTANFTGSFTRFTSLFGQYPPPYGVTPLSSIFLISTPYSEDRGLSALWPIKLLANRGAANRVSLYVYISRRYGADSLGGRGPNWEGWQESGFFPELKTIKGEEWLELKYLGSNVPTFIGLSPDQGLVVK